MPRLRGLPKTGGRPKGSLNKATKAVKEIAGQFTEAAVMTLAAIMTDPLAPHAARVAACSALLDRGHGRPHQTGDVTVAEKQHFVVAPSKSSDEEWAATLEKRRAMVESVTPKPKPAPLEAKQNGNQKPQLPN